MKDTGENQTVGVVVSFAWTPCRYATAMADTGPFQVKVTA